MATIQVKVRPNAGKFAVRLEAPGKFRVDLKEAPEKGKANRELIIGLSRLLGTQVRLLGGGAGRRKLLEIGLDARDIEARLAASE